MERINSRLEAIQQEIYYLDYEKREKKIFLSLETLQIKKVKINNLKDELLNIIVDKLDEIAKKS